MLMIVLKLKLLLFQGFIFCKEAVDGDFIVMTFENTVCIWLKLLVPHSIKSSFEAKLLDTDVIL
mgnify:CR=1 FL=1